MDGSVADLVDGKSDIESMGILGGALRVVTESRAEKGEDFGCRGLRHRPRREGFLRPTQFTK